MGNKIITGYWDGVPITREQTSGEKLADLIDEDLNEKRNTNTGEDMEQDVDCKEQQERRPVHRV